MDSEQGDLKERLDAVLQALRDHREHTPGPWAWVRPGDRGDAADKGRIDGPQDQTVCAFGYDGRTAKNAGYAPSEADGRLMEASPDLLRASVRLLLTHGCGLVDPECADCRDMRAAIAKAEGRQ
jgi:hypothetical protein